MAKTSYIKPKDADFLAQMKAFRTNIPEYNTAINVSPAQISVQSADTDYLEYILTCQSVTQGCAGQWTTWKEILRYGGVLPSSSSPVPPVFPAVVAPVTPGIESRFRALAQAIKAHPDYNPAIGQILGIEGTQQTGPDLATVQPQFDVKLKGNQVLINWGWGGNASFLDLCEIQVDRGDGQGFRLLAYDTTPGYTDTQPLPATPAKWTYRAIYRVGDAQVGIWSLPVAINVGA